MMKTSSGFTLLELMLAIGMLSVLAAILIPVYQTFQVKNALDTGAYEAVASFRRAQLLSQAAETDTTWGVSVQTGTITLFKGASYVARDAAYDETFELPTSVAPTGMTEVVFTEVSGVPLTTGTLTLTSSTGLQRLITLNAKGMLTY